VPGWELPNALAKLARAALFGRDCGFGKPVALPLMGTPKPHEPLPIVAKRASSATIPIDYRTYMLAKSGVPILPFGTLAEPNGTLRVGADCWPGNPFGNVRNGGGPAPKV
jgi:hypothetical protein